MKKFRFVTVVIFSLLSFRIVIAEQGQNKMLFWSQTQKGANVFNQHIYRIDIKAAKNYKISFIRLAPDKFLSKKRDFLIGDADNYVQLIPEDLAALKKILDIYAEEQMPVVLTMLSLPGSRWKQNNNNKDDLRLWSNTKLQEQAVKFWQDLALELKNHPAIVGYNILNEPHPERIYDATGTHIYATNQEEVQKKLFDFYGSVIAAIRKVDKNTPIILDSSAYSDPKTFKCFKVHNDSNILYSFHMYEPYEYTNHKTNKGKFNYPGKIKNLYWDKKALKIYMQNVSEFQKINNISNNRILVGEFGGYRSSGGLSRYFKDLIDIFKEKKWHFAFYAFREDTWDGMDYELGNQKITWIELQAIEKGQIPKLDRRTTYQQFKVLIDSLPN